jgi:hypothetical protein
LRLTVFGEMRTGFVEMANGVQLNPAHSRWLMGLPHAWDESSPGWQEWRSNRVGRLKGYGNAINARQLRLSFALIWGSHDARRKENALRSIARRANDEKPKRRSSPALSCDEISRPILNGCMPLIKQFKR